MADNDLSQTYTAPSFPRFEPRSTRPDPIPPGIVKAILDVSSKIGKIEFDAENKHGGYEYASVDAIFRAIRKLQADAGLIVLPLEVECEKLGEKAFRITFEFVLATEKETWSHPSLRRTVVLSWMGPQSFQAAQSYCEKAFYKSLYKLDTGEPDQESEQPGEDANRSDSKKKAAPKVEPMSDADSKRAKDDLVASISRLKTPLDGQEAEDWAQKYGATIDRLTHADKVIVREAFKEKRRAK